MKTMKFTAPSTAMAILTALAFTPSSTLASGENFGDTQRCIHLSLIDDSPAIDDRTILVEMRGKRRLQTYRFGRLVFGTHIQRFHVFNTHRQTLH